jgi:hypothetical protein
MRWIVLAAATAAALFSPTLVALDQALAAKVRLVVWCNACGHQTEPDIAEQVARYGADASVPDWAARLRCSACGEREADFVVSGATPPDKPLGAATARAAGGRLIAVSTSAVLAGGSGVTRMYGRRRGSAVACRFRERERGEGIRASLLWPLAPRCLTDCWATNHNRIDGTTPA